MAIQMRRGANSDFNPSKMLPGEIAVTTDGTRKVYAAFKANDVKELASKEDVQGLINGFTSVVDREITEAEQRIESKGQQVLDTIPDMYEEVSARADEAVRTKADAIVCSVSGVNPIAKDSSNDYMRNLKLYGKTTQGDNPSPSNPQPLESKGKWGNLAQIEYIPKYSSEEVNCTFDKPYTGYLNFCIYFTGGSSQINARIFDANGEDTNVGIVASTGANNTWHCNNVYVENAMIVKLYNVDSSNERTVGKMLIRYGSYSSVSDSDYRPYSGQMEIESGVLSGNLLENTRDSYTEGDVTFTVNVDKSVTVKGTANWNTYLRLSDDINQLYSEGDYILTGGTPNVIIQIIANNQQTVITNTGGDTKFNLNGATDTFARIAVLNGKTANETVYPMIRKAEITDRSYVPYSRQSHISLVGDGLKGMALGTDINAFPDVIKSNQKHMSGVWWDYETNQYWISNTVDSESGLLVQRIGGFVFDGSTDEYWSVMSDSNAFRFHTFVLNGLIVAPKGNASKALIMCTQFTVKTANDTYLKNEGISVQANSGDLFIYCEQFNSVEDFRAHLSTNNMIVHAILATPIETPLSADEIASYKALKSNYKVTRVMNDCEAFMEVTYNADMETWINNVIDERISKALAQYKEE